MPIFTTWFYFSPMRFTAFKYLVFLAVTVASAACQRTWQPKPQLTQTTNPVTEKLAADALSESTIVPYRQQVTVKMNEVIGTATEALEKAAVESSLGNFVADLQRYQAQVISGKPVDLGVMTNGGLRTSLPKGNLKVGDIFELMPFENELVVLTVSGETVQKLFNYAASKQTTTISNATYKIKDNLPQEIKIGGLPFDSSKTYRIAISDYLANRGDAMDFFQNTIATEKVGITVRDAIMKHIKELSALQKPVEAKIEGRVVLLK